MFVVPRMTGEVDKDEDKDTEEDDKEGEGDVVEGSQMLANASLNEAASIGTGLPGSVFEETDVVERRRDPELDRAWVGDCKNESD
ncbi:hypothetical protein BGZ81_007583 [Podila clonocystis]|nr:hypothetical protein BGZ81_007583 [Podila clonocystis]